MLLSALSATAVASAHAQAAPAPSRGQLLYDTHCIECHNTQVHWRSARAATNWSSLVAQVRRWQASGNLRWSEGDIVQVARHLNDTIYHFPQASLTRRD